MFIHSEIKMTKFYALCKQGVIVECPYIKRKYFYNQSRVNLGFPAVEVSELRKKYEQNCEAS